MGEVLTMAVKYTREPEESARTRISERLGTHEPVRRGGLFSFQQGGGGGGLFISLGAVIFALMLFQTMVDRMRPEPERVEAGVGTVIGKAEADPEGLGERPLLHLRIETPEGVVREVWVPTDFESWGGVSEGDTLEVEFAVRGQTGPVRVQRLRAPPEPE